MEENFMAKDFEERLNILNEVSANILELSISSQLKFDLDGRSSVSGLRCYLMAS